MYRCLAAASLAVAFVTPAAAQLSRSFPQNALRGVIVVTDPPDITLNGKPARLAPGARIRGQTNMIELTGSLTGARMLVNYTLDLYGQLKDIWILLPEEAAVRPWPTRPEQLDTWVFDAVTQTWSRP